MVFQFSAGGVVFKKDSELKILVCQHSQHHGWVFPKGLIGDKEDNKKESKEVTALREVKEEAGAEAKIILPLTPVTFWFVWSDPSKSSGQEKIKKTVYYFLMEYTGGNITQHDHEMENVEWIDPEDIEKRLTYSSDKKVWREAKEIIAKANYY